MSWTEHVSANKSIRMQTSNWNICWCLTCISWTVRCWNICLLCSFTLFCYLSLFCYFSLFCSVCSFCALFSFCPLFSFCVLFSFCALCQFCALCLFNFFVRFLTFSLLVVLSISPHYHKAKSISAAHCWVPHSFRSPSVMLLPKIHFKGFCTPNSQLNLRCADRWACRHQCVDRNKHTSEINILSSKWEQVTWKTSE